MKGTSLVLATLLAAAGAAAQEVQRCEGSDGRVSYANGPCPPETRPVRTLPATPAPSAADQKAAQQQAQKDVRDAAALDRARKAEDERLAREAVQAQASAKKLEMQCRRLDGRLRSAQEELAGATSSQRAEAQRRVRKAEELYVADCGPVQK